MTYASRRGRGAVGRALDRMHSCLGWQSYDPDDKGRQNRCTP